jgi:hypothetical protein
VKDLSRFNNFDLIRLIAAAQVMYNHSIIWLHIPQLSAIEGLVDMFPGVPIFFVVSGFLVTRSFVQNDGRLGRSNVISGENCSATHTAMQRGVGDMGVDIGEAGLAEVVRVGREADDARARRGSARARAATSRLRRWELASSARASVECGSRATRSASNSRAAVWSVSMSARRSPLRAVMAEFQAPVGAATSFPTPATNAADLLLSEGRRAENF